MTVEPDPMFPENIGENPEPYLQLKVANYLFKNIPSKTLYQTNEKESKFVVPKFVLF